MVPVRCFHQFSTVPFLFLSPPCNRISPCPPFLLPLTIRRPLAPLVSFSDNLSSLDPYKQKQQSQPRTLYPGGYKRPEIEVPSLVLQLEPDDVLDIGSDPDVLDLIDKAVSKWVRIIVLNVGQATAAKLYEAACLLKSVVQDRAYLLVAERADIAAAAGASGVVLSDQGLPAIVARNTMLDSRSGSVVLPLVARNVQSADAAFVASRTEGADFLIYSTRNWKRGDSEVESLFKNVKIPIFISLTTEDVSIPETLSSLSFGPSGFVLSLKSFLMLSDDGLVTIVENIRAKNGKRIKQELLNMDNGFPRRREVLAGFLNLDEREKQFIETEKSVLIEAMQVIEKSAPLMEEISLLDDAISQIDEPFLLAIVGEFNSGKSSVINALLGERYLEEGVVPTTNEITFLRHSEFDSEKQYCQRHPDGQFVCYLPAPILKQMIIVDTPGTNVILQRQQRLTEEFVPRADLLLFVISADRPLTESEVSFLRYTQQWKKKAVFVLNKADLYQNTRELEEAMLFIKENVQKLLNAENVILYPVSARSALESKLLASSEFENHHAGSDWRANSFSHLEKFLYSFLDGSSSTGMERMKLKLETPVGIADRLISACDILSRQEARKAKQDLASINDIVNSIKDFAMKMENESLSWRRQILSLVDNAESRVLELVEGTLRLSNLDIVASYVFRGEKSVNLPVTSRIQNDIIGLAVSSARNLLVEYGSWLQSNNTRQVKLYVESFEKMWPSVMHQNREVHLERYALLKKVNQASYRVIDTVNSIAFSKSFDREIREVYLGTFGGLGTAGLSASLLTSVLPTTLEDLLALGLCSAGGYLAISYFPIRRQKVIDKVKTAASALANELEEAMKKDLILTIEDLENFVKVLSQPYQDEAQSRLDRSLQIQDELSEVDKKLRTLRINIQNLHTV